MFAFACSALFFETLAYLNDFSKHRTRYSSDCWTSALRWRFADVKTTTCCVRNFVTTFVCRLFYSLNNFSFSDAWCFSKSSFFLNQDFFYRKAKRRRRWRDFFVVKDLLSVDIELIERRLLNIFETYRSRIDFVRHMFEILSFSVILTLHCNDQIEWLFSQLIHFLLFTISCTLNHHAIRHKLNFVVHVDRSCRCDHIVDN